MGDFMARIQEARVSMNLPTLIKSKPDQVKAKRYTFVAGVIGVVGVYVSQRLTRFFREVTFFSKGLAIAGFFGAFYFASLRIVSTVGSYYLFLLEKLKGEGATILDGDKLDITKVEGETAIGIYQGKTSGNNFYVAFSDGVGGATPRVSLLIFNVGKQECYHCRLNATSATGASEKYVALPDWLELPQFTVEPSSCDIFRDGDQYALTLEQLQNFAKEDGAE